MARVRIPLSNFEFGEISESFTSRTDSPIYTAAASKIRNFIILSEGGLKKRPGSSKIYEFSNTVGTDRLEVRAEPFIFSDDEQYIVAFSNAKLDIFQINVSTGVTTHIQSITQDVDSNALVWNTNTIIEEFTFAQELDNMIICHPDFMPQLITRTSATTFEVSTFTFATSTDGDKIHQPYWDFQPAGMTIQPSAVTGTGVTLTTSGDYFVSDHVGSYLLIGDTHCLITGYTSATQVTATVNGTIRKNLIFDPITTVAHTTTLIITHIGHGLDVGDTVIIERADAVGGLSANNINGSRIISAIVDEDSYEVTAGGTSNASEVGGGAARVTSTAATTGWYEQSYSTVRGYPSAITFHEGRLWFAGTPSQPDHIWASKSGRFFNFDVGDGGDSDSIDLSGGFGEYNRVQHLVSNRDLQVFATSSESFVPAFSNAPITPTTAQVKRQTPFGSSPVRPQLFDGSTIYTQKNGKMIGSYLYSEQEQAYNTANISITAEHLVRNPTQMATIQGGFDRPESYLLSVNPDGTISIFYSLRGDKKAGWALWNTPGKYHSVCVVDDRVFSIVIRDNGSGTDKFYLEEFRSDMPMDFCDLYTGTAGVFDVSADFANSAEVKAVSGNDYLGEYTVTSGNVDTSAVKEVTSAYIGYQFEPELQTLPIDANLASGALTAQPRQITMVTLDLVNTLSVSVNDKPLVLRATNDDFSLDRETFTGKKEFRLIGISRDPRVTIKQPVPFDLQVNGMIVEVAF